MLGKNMGVVASVIVGSLIIASAIIYSRSEQKSGLFTMADEESWIEHCVHKWEGRRLHKDSTFLFSEDGARSYCMGRWAKIVKR